jgi:hypothetical protein
VNGVKALDVTSLPKSDVTTPTNVGEICLKQGANALVIKAISIPESGYIDSIQVGSAP